MFKIKNKKNILIALSLLSIILILKSPTLNKPYFWDGLFWMESVEWMVDNNLNLTPPGPLDQGGLDTGHPVLFPLILAVAYSLFGKSLIVAHLVIIFSAFFMLYFTYLLGAYLYNEKTGLIATALLLFSPLFFAQSSLINVDILLATFTVITLYFALRNKLIPYLISGSFLVLLKEPGLFTILAVVIYIFVKDYKQSKRLLFKKCLLYSLPFVPFLSWLLFHSLQQTTGVISGAPTFWKPVTFIIFFRFLNRINYFFFEDFHWILTGIILFSLINFKKLSSQFNTKRFMLIISFGLLILILSTYGLKFLLLKTDLLTSFFSSNNTAFYISEKNLKGILLNLYFYRFIFASFIFLLIIAWKNVYFTIFKNKKLIPIIFTFLFYLILFSWTLNLPRYHLPLYPFFLILSAYALNNLFRKGAYFISIVIIILFITQWTSDSADTRGYLLEKNMDYLDVVETHKSMTEYIENFFPNAVVLTMPRMTDELRYPSLGYVKKSISPLDYTHYDSKANYKTIYALQNGDWYYFSCYLKKRCDMNYFIPINKGDIISYDTRYTEALTSDDFDLFYYSPQSHLGTGSKSLVEDFNLTLIKRFEKNGRYTELYATEKFLKQIPSISY